MMPQQDLNRAQNLRIGGALIAAASVMIAIGLLVRAFEDLCYMSCLQGSDSGMLAFLAVVIGIAGPIIGLTIRARGKTHKVKTDVEALGAKTPPAVLSKTRQAIEDFDQTSEAISKIPLSVTGLAAELLAKGVKKAIDEADGTPGDSGAEPRALPKVGEE